MPNSLVLLVQILFILNSADMAGIKAFSLGQQEFLYSWNIQKKIWAKRSSGELDHDVLLFLEHDPVFTLGIGGNEDNVLSRKSPLDGKNVPVLRINRGGEVTFHGPGQLMVYAIFDLRNYGKDVHVHCRKLEEIFVKYSCTIGLHIFRKDKSPGLWVGDLKILSLGIGVRRWITMHGVSFNVSPNLDFFKMINTCGSIDERITSLESLNLNVSSIGDLITDLIPICSEIFDQKVVVCEPNDLDEILFS